MRTFISKTLMAFPFLKMPWAIGAIGFAVVLVLVGLCSGPCRVTTKPPIPPKAILAHDAGVEAKGEAKAHTQIAMKRDPALQAARAELVRIKAELAQALAAIPQPAAGPAPANPTAQALVKCLEVNQAQDRKSGLLEDQLATRTAEADALGRAAAAFEQEALVLRKGIKPVYTRAVGGIWNPGDQTYGVCFEQDVGPRLRIGADVFQQRLPAPAGGSIKWAAQLRALYRF